MLSCFPSSLEHGDIIGLNHNDDFVAGKVVSVSMDKYKFWIIVTEKADNEVDS